MNLKQTWQTAKERVPGTPANKDRKQKTYAENIQKNAKEAIDLELAKKQLAEKQQPQPKQEQLGTTSFKNTFADAIMHGYTREGATTLDVGIRRAVRSEEFVSAIGTATADSPLATPIESDDKEYAKGMHDVRLGLANKLGTGNVSSLSNDELDIILTTIFAKDEKDLRRFPEVYQELFGFLEGAACSSPGKEGEYIRDTLLALTTMNTMGEHQMQTTRNLADTASIDHTLAAIADPMIERAVGQFNDTMGSVLSTPTTELHPELGVPGLGYAYRPGVNKAVAEVNSAAKAEASASERHNDAVRAGMYAKMDNVKEQTRRTVQLTETALKAATERKNNAIQALLTLVPELNNMQPKQQNALIAKLMHAEQQAQTILNKLTDAFRLAFIDCRRENNPMDDAALAKLCDNGHPLVVQLIAEIRDATGTRTTEGQNKATAKAGALTEKINGVQLPPQVKADLNKVVQMIAKAETDGAAIETETCRVEKSYAYPVRKVAAYAMMKYSEVRTGSIPDEQWITARVGFQGKVSLKNLPLKYENSFARQLRNDLQRIEHFQLPDAWWLRYPIQAGGIMLPYYPVKWFWKAAVRNDNFKREIRNQRGTYTDKDGNKQPSRWKNKHKARFQAAIAWGLATELITSLVFSVRFSTQQTYGFWDYAGKALKGAINWYWRIPPAQLSVAPGSAIRSPTKWFTPQLTVYDKKTIDDSHEIPQRLSGRGREYYQKAYGVGLDGTDAAKKRLGWLESHPGVLQYFQERTSNRKVVPTDEMPKGWMVYPKILGNKPDGKPILSITYNKAAGDTNAAGTPDTVWDILYMNTVPIADGLVLNKVNSDRFVDLLMAMERSGANGHGFLGNRNTIFFGNRELDYEFMQANQMGWEDNGFLLPKERLELMERFGIKDNGNSLFLALQPGAAGMLAPYSQLGASSRYVEKPDAFVAAWRKGVKDICGEDPTGTASSPGVLKQAFDNAVNSGFGTTIRDATAEFEEAQIMKKLGTNYALGEATTNLLRDAANADVRGLLMQFGGTSGYHLNPGRVEQFVQRLVEYKRNKGDIDDFNPFAHGKRVGWALGQGYFQAGAFTKDEALQASETGTTRLQSQRGTLSDEAKAFYAGEGGSEVDKLLTAMGAGDGQRMAVYKLLSDDSERAKDVRKLATITATGSGEGMTVEIRNKGQAKQWLKGYLQK